MLVTAATTPARIPPSGARLRALGRAAQEGEGNGSESARRVRGRPGWLEKAQDRRKRNRWAYGATRLVAPRHAPMLHKTKNLTHARVAPAPGGHSRRLGGFVTAVYTGPSATLDP